MRPFDSLSHPAGPVFLSTFVVLAVAALGCEPSDTDPAAAESELGTVELPTSCSEAVQPSLERGLLLLHHMMYARAERTFQEAVEAEEDCAMAHWGVAMARFQPLWGSAEVEAGRPAAERAVELQPPAERERLYVRAALAFYEDSDADHLERVRSWASAMEELHRSHPDDPEAGALWALAHLSVGPDQPERQERTIATLETIHERMPRHPGALHYAIHAHDVEGRAEDGVRYAEAYREVAPSIPHPLHMPSHIYVRIGEWDEVIAWNRRSAEAALEHPAGEHISLHYAHALDYLMYGHLQRAQDREASGVLEELRSREGYQPHGASAYALAAMPARWYVERRDWAGASELEPRKPASFPWDDFPYAEAMTWFARGLGAARTGDLERARTAAERLAELGEAAAEADQPYWARQAEVQRASVSAWRALAEGREEEAVETMRETAERAAAMEKHPITPGALQPAGELLGDLLLEVDRPGEALEAYEATLATWPRRYHSLLGAARAAERLGREGKADQRYREFAELTAGSDPVRDAVAEVRSRLEEAR